MVFGDGGKGDAHREVRNDENERDEQEKWNAALHWHMKEKVGRDQDDRHLDVAD